MSKSGDITLTQALASNSKDFQRLNPHLFQNAPQSRQDARGEVLIESKGKGSGKRKGKRRREMNAIEREFSMILQARMDREEIVSFEYEGMMLRWGDGLRYSPDFKVVTSIVSGETEHEAPAQRITLIEIKGAYCWRQDLVRYKAAKANWPLYRFEFWEKIDGIWQMTR